MRFPSILLCRVPNSKEAVQQLDRKYPQLRFCLMYNKRVGDEKRLKIRSGKCQLRKYKTELKNDYVAGSENY